MTGQQQRRQYLRTQIQTASPEQLVLMLYDGVVRFAELGKKAMAAEDLAGAHEHLTRAQDIILELLHTLDREKGGELAENMAKLYGYAYQCMIEANLQKDPDKIAPVQDIFRSLRDGWSEAMGSMRDEASEGKAEASAPSPDTVETSAPAAKSTAAPIDLKTAANKAAADKMNGDTPAKDTPSKRKSRPDSGVYAAAGRAGSYAASGQGRLSVQG